MPPARSIVKTADARSPGLVRWTECDDQQRDGAGDRRQVQVDAQPYDPEHSIEETGGCHCCRPRARTETICEQREAYDGRITSALGLMFVRGCIRVRTRVP